MINEKKAPLVFCSLAVLTSLLMLKTTAQSTNTAALITRKAVECDNLANFYETYQANVNSGFKVLDALEAQNQLIRKQDSVSCYA